MHHRYASVAVDLARRLLTLQEGNRLDPIGLLAEEFQTGRGTVQSALKILLDEGALTIERMGNQGSFIKHLNHTKLLEKAELTTIIGSISVAYSSLRQGLATGLYRTFQQAELPLLLTQLRGAKNRLHFLQTGRSDFAIISKLAWEEIKHNQAYRLLLEFGPGSNVGDHVLLMNDHHGDRITDGMKVGIDSSSYDHLRLTLEECKGKSVQLIETSYGQSFEKLFSGEIDATIWDAAMIPPPSFLKIVPLAANVIHSDANTEACMIARSDSGAFKDIIQKHIDPKQVIGIQRRVVTREIPPTF